MRFNDRRWWTAGAAAIVTIGVISALLLHTGSDRAPLRARQYTASHACLLTGTQGITDPQAATVWAGMEDASLTSHTKVTYLSTAGPATTANAIPYANSLIQQHCNIVLAVGPPQTNALAQLAHHTPTTHFVLLGTNGNSPPSKNLTRLSISPDTRSQVAHTVETAVNE